MSEAEDRCEWEMVEALLATGPERCTVCDTPFPHGDGEYGGLLEGKPEVVGGCCLERLTKVLSFGLCVCEPHKRKTR